ncbi:hypothetical protein FACS1894185_3550 [Betaproteobacteria bacterium]|nr:hypothetical protein FACS1894185_3550 [Betaproteobacteria bacterium]
MLHAWACDQGLLVARKAVDEKANEMVAIPDVLSLFDLSGVTVTIDAMGCQKTIAQQIVEGRGDYVLALKGNQGALYADVRLFMEELAKKEAPSEESCEKDHGRIETRRVWVSDRIDWIEEKRRFMGLKSLALVEAVRETGDKTSTERRCFLSSLSPDAKLIGQRIRAHWSIENNLHRVLDMAFNEDQSRVRTGHAAENFALIRRFALNLLRHDSLCKRSIKRKRFRASHDDEYRSNLLNITPIPLHP